MRKEFHGFIQEDEGYGTLTRVGGEHIFEEIDDNFKRDEKVFIRYYISDKEITLEQAIEANILKTTGGNIDAIHFVLDAYSEYTVIELSEALTVDGHDIVNTLSNNYGKYLILIIESV